MLTNTDNACLLSTEDSNIMFVSQLTSFRDTKNKAKNKKKPPNQTKIKQHHVHLINLKNLKGRYADHILIPKGSTGSYTFFWYQMKAHMFLIANPKFRLQILYSFGAITKSVKLNGIPENNFLCIFIIASSPGVHTFFCLWRVNKKLPQGKTSQNAFQRSRSIN